MSMLDKANEIISNKDVDSNLSIWYKGDIIWEN